MLEYNWTRLLNKCMHAVTRYHFLFFQYPKNCTFKKMTSTVFSYAKHHLSTKKQQQTMMPTQVGAGQKFESCYFCNSKHFCQSIMRPCYSCYFCVFYIFKFFQTIIVSLFLAGHDQYLKHSNVFELINFSFQTKYNNTIAFLLIAIIYSRGEKKKKTIVETIL